MLALERRNLIIEKLNMNGKVYVSSLSVEFDVSEETIRRDIEKLSIDGLAIKTYGGAVSNTTKVNLDLPYNLRKKENVEEKIHIANIVSNMIKDGDKIMLDASSTSIFITKAIKSKKNLTVITNSVEILLELASQSGWTVFSTGGALREGSYSLSGSSAEKMISNHHVDIAICSAKGIDSTMGITESNEKDAEIKKAIFNSASKRVLCLDDSKFEKISFIKVCEIKDIDVLVTNKEPSESWKKKILDAKVDLKY